MKYRFSGVNKARKRSKGKLPLIKNTNLYKTSDKFVIRYQKIKEHYRKQNKS